LDPENFLGDLAILLATAGKGDAALLQVEHNLELYGDNDWVRIKAGDVYAELGVADRAEAEHRRVLEASEDWFARERVLERLRPLLEAQGRTEEAETLTAERSTDALSLLRSSTPEARTAPKVGRNDPCPCDSGRKFKKCCGAA
jgi:tetratricopeptide (TPR) repeat protein